MSGTKRIFWTCIAAIVSLSVFLAVPALSVGFFTGRFTDFVAWYLGFFLLVNLLLAVSLLPLLPLVVWSIA